MSKEPPKSKDKNADKDVLALDDFRHQPSVDDQALTWFVKLSDHQSDKLKAATLRRKFFIWLNADPAHGAAFEEVATLWSMAGEAAANPLFRPQPRYRQSIIGVMSAAALVMVAVLVLVVSPDRYHTNPGEQQRIVLDDGSTVFLNTDSVIEVRLRQARRIIAISRGEAWFDVAHDPNRPFEVTAGDVTARAVGTAFAVRRFDTEDVCVTVTEGQVEVRHSTETESVAEGQQIKVTNADAGNPQILPPQNIDTEQVLAWQRGFLVYENIQLDELLSDLNRYVSRNVVLSDDKVGHRTVSAVIQIADQEAMLDALNIAMGLHWKEVSEELIMVTPRIIN